MTESPTASSHGQTTVILCSTITIAYSLSNDDRKSTVFSLRRNVVSDGAFLTDDGRLFHARAETTGNLERHGRLALNVWWTVPEEASTLRRRQERSVKLYAVVNLKLK